MVSRVATMRGVIPEGANRTWHPHPRLQHSLEESSATGHVICARTFRWHHGEARLRRFQAVLVAGPLLWGAVQGEHIEAPARHRRTQQHDAFRGQVQLPVVVDHTVTIGALLCLQWSRGKWSTERILCLPDAPMQPCSTNSMCCHGASSGLSRTDAVSASRRSPFFASIPKALGASMASRAPRSVMSTASLAGEVCTCILSHVKTPSPSSSLGNVRV